MSLLLQIIVIYIKENIITKFQKLYSPPKKSRVGNKWPMLFVKKLRCMGNLSPTRKIFIERPEVYFYCQKANYYGNCHLMTRVPQNFDTNLKRLLWNGFGESLFIFWGDSWTHVGFQSLSLFLLKGSLVNPLNISLAQ